MVLWPRYVYVGERLSYRARVAMGISSNGEQPQTRRGEIQPALRNTPTVARPRLAVSRKSGYELAPRETGHC